MLPDSTIALEKLEAIVFDFDGVLTDNKVYLDQDGKESVSCNRADGLAFDVLHKLQKPTYILSTEKNPVVTARANKLKIPAVHGISNKVDGIKDLAVIENFDLKKTLYVGNDLNDYRVMQLCGYTACPADSHKKIKKISNIILKTSGGNGVVRELIEDIFQLNFIQILYPEKERK
jgi:3-deoxy-D-manno-octulosonate 8-phosphate phosphatase (KDO 8-P phosphatase)